MTLKIVQAGEPVLRRPARELSRAEILEPETQSLIELMRDTMRDAPGVGLAAPQIGLALQLAVIEDRQDYVDRISPQRAVEFQRRAIPFHVIINPVIQFFSKDRAEFFEGCLSVAGFQALVPRSLKVRVQCLNEQAEPMVIEAEGWYARILQHEIDHLHGTLYLDHMHPRSFMTLANYERHWKDRRLDEVRAETQRFKGDVETSPR